MANNETGKRGSGGRFAPGVSGNPAGRPKSVVQASSVGNNRPAPASRKPDNVMGSSGTIIFNGFIVKEEYNSDLIGKKGLDIYDQMRKSDATVKAALQVIKLPILGANWRMQSFSDDPQDELINDFVSYNMFEIFPFDDFLRQVLTFLEFGFSVHEIIWDIIEWNGQKYTGLQQLAWRRQSTIWQWALDNGDFGVKQFVPGGSDGGFKEIPGDKVLIFTNEREGENYAGVSILRPAYKHWFFKDAFYKIQAIAAERNGVGIPVVKVPDAAKPEDVEKMRELARNTRANEQGYIEVPKDFDFEFADMKGRNIKDLNPDINHHDRQIMKSVLAQFLELGSADASGSYNLSTDQSRLFMQSIQWVAKYVAQIVNQELIPKLVDLNFGNVKGYPALAFEKIGDDNITELGTVLPQLVAAGLITPTPEDEEHLRKSMGMPDIPDSSLDDEESDNISSNPSNTTPAGNPPGDTGSGTEDTSAGQQALSSLRADRAKRDRILGKMQANESRETRAKLGAQIKADAAKKRKR